MFDIATNPSDMMVGYTEISIPTGRTYDCEQVIECQLVKSVFDGGCGYSMTFNCVDKSRHMEFNTTIVVFDFECGEDVVNEIMDAYDNGFFTDGLVVEEEKTKYKYYEVRAIAEDGTDELLFGSYDKKECKYEVRTEKQNWIADGYRNFRLDTRITTEAPDPSVYGEDFKGDIVA